MIYGEYFYELIVSKIHNQKQVFKVNVMQTLHKQEKKLNQIKISSLSFQIFQVNMLLIKRWKKKLNANIERHTRWQGTNTLGMEKKQYNLQ